MTVNKLCFRFYFYMVANIVTEHPKFVITMNASGQFQSIMPYCLPN